MSDERISADPDLPLIQQLKAGDDRAMKTLITRYQGSLWHFVMRYTQNEEDTEDIVSETFTLVYFNAAKFKPKARVKTWLYTIAVNLSRRHQHRKRLRQTFSLESLRQDHAQQNWLEVLPSGAPEVYEQAILAEQLKEAEKQIQLLPNKLKSAFILAVLEGLSHRECSVILNCSEKAVETRVYRARSLLRERFWPHSKKNPLFLRDLEDLCI